MSHNIESQGIHMIHAGNCIAQDSLYHLITPFHLGVEGHLECCGYFGGYDCAYQLLYCLSIDILHLDTLNQKNKIF